MNERQKCSFVTDVLHAELAGFHSREVYKTRKFTDCEINIAGWLLIVVSGESDSLHLCDTGVINLFLFSRFRAGGEK
jgi:hypothetical protein